MNRDISISFYNGVNDNKGIPQPLATIITLLKQPSNVAHLIARYRKLLKEDPKAAEEEKKGLPAVTWSGLFSKRNAKDLQEYSGLICIDIDKQEPDRLRELYNAIKGDEYTYTVFVSPSHNGLKIVIRVAGGPEKHLRNFIALEDYYKKTFQVEIDKSGKDINRLCFLCPQKSLYVNAKSSIFESKPDQQAEYQKLTALTKPQQQEFKSNDSSLDSVKFFTDRLYKLEPGNRNSYIFIFSANCNRKGIDINDCLTYIAGLVPDKNIKEVSATVRSAYIHNENEFGKYAKKNNNNTRTKGQGRKNIDDGNKRGDSGPAEVRILQNGNGVVKEIQEPPRFWIEEEVEPKGGGTPFTKYSLYYLGMMDFLEFYGYFRLPMKNGTYEFIRYYENICETVQPIHMQDHVVYWCKEKAEFKVLEMLFKGCERYFNAKKLSNLAYRNLSFVQDTETEAYYFFRNCYVKVTADNITTHQITDFQKTLWRSSIIDRDFSRQAVMMPQQADGHFDLDGFKCEMAKFIALVSCNPNQREVLDADTIYQRFAAICTSIGYMLHGYKSKIGKAIIAIDHKIPEDKQEQNGGTGKSIVGESFRYLKSTGIIDGRDFREDYPFRFEMIGVDTKIVVMKDCKHNLDFGSFFVPITDDFTFNKRHTGYITIPYDDAPKWWFDTNFVFKGDGTSFRRRQHIVEFDDFFTEEHTPLDEFGHYLFNGWNEKEGTADQWNLFYNFYFQCVQMYLAAGLIEYPKGNMQHRKLLMQAPQEFIDFLDASDDQGQFIHAARNHEFEKKNLLKKWNDECFNLNMTKPSPHQFTKWTKAYCTTKGYSLLNRKSNGTEFWVIADKNYKPTPKPDQQTLFS